MNTTLSKRFGKKQSLIAALAIICSFLTYFLLPAAFPEAGRRVAAVFVFAIFFWAFELIPLYATSLLVVILLTFLLTKPGGVLGLGQTGFHLFLIPFSSPVIMLFLGGFVLARAIRKHQADSFIMHTLLSKIGNRSSIVMLSFLFMSAFFSMWISNTAATAMILLLIKPILTQIDADDPLRKGLVIATAFGANIGGIGTPIGTPPNAIAIGILAEYGIEIDFITWMLVAIPLALVILSFTALVILLLFPAKAKQIHYSLPTKTPLSRNGLSVLIIALFVILLWLTKPLHQIPEALVALLGVGLFAAFQLINTEDFKMINWDVLVLMWGGLALGEGLRVSGMIDQLVELPLFAYQGFGLIVTFSILTVILSSFISNTATANLLLPIAVTLGTVDKGLFALMVALSCSLALAFPISTPPNAMAYATHTFRTKDLFKAGSLVTLGSITLILLCGKYLIVNRI